MFEGDDAALVRRITAGDSAALGDVYDRYADRIFDLCVHLLHDRHEAADATADVFLKVGEKIGTLRDGSKLRPWIYAIARHEIYRRTRRRRREVPVDLTDSSVVALEPDHETGGDTPEEIVSLVRDAALGLDDRDRIVLELTLMGGLDGEDLGEALGVSASTAHQVAHRMRERLGRSVAGLLVARGGRSDCDELARLLEPWDGTYSVIWRKRVARHVDVCEGCGARSAALPLAALSGAALTSPLPITYLVAPAALRATVLGLGGLAAGSGSAAAGAGAGAAGLRAAAKGRSTASQTATAVAAAAAVVAAVVVGLRWSGSDSPIAARVTTTTSPAAPPATSPPTPPVVAPVAVEPATTVRPAPTTTRPRRPTTTAPPTTAPPTTIEPTTAAPTTAPPTTAPQTTAPPTTTLPPDVTGPTVAIDLPATLRIACGTTTLSATLGDPAGVASLRLDATGPLGWRGWRNGQGWNGWGRRARTTTVTFSSGAAGSWTGDWSPPTPGRSELVFTATDLLGNTSTTRVQVVADGC